jgi:uncharacterized membrane protein YbaN (DUF454 family)
MKRVLLEVCGWGFIVLGIAGLFLPILQGILFLLVGLTILSVEHHWARRWIAKILERFPRAESGLKKFLGRHARHIPGLHAEPTSDKETV